MIDTTDNPSLAGAKFNIDRLIRLLLDADEASRGNRWREKCAAARSSGGSCGTARGPARAMYGDDYQSPELALIALSQAPPPHYVIDTARLS